ncbi:hypothetical protein JTE90_029590, partial [Oedothorax gibbosus]
KKLTFGRFKIKLTKMEPTENTTSSSPTDSTEDNLSELLDSCIDDFNKPLPPATQPKKTANAVKSPPTSNEVANTPADSPAAAWSSEFKDFNSVMENLIGGKSEMEELQKLMEGCLPQNMGESEGDDENFAASFAESLRHLTEQAQNVPEPSPEDLSRLLGSLDIQGALGDMEGGMPELMPLMQEAMQKLMSKELLYPSLKEICDKYPAWLAENKESLKAKEYENYEKQFSLMKDICAEFEKDCPEDSQKQQFEKVLELMQKLQTFGNPPKELVSDIGPGIPLDDQGNVQIPGMPANCVVM